MTINLRSLTVGTDAEIPLVLVDGTPFPVTRLVGGSKEEPRPLPELGEGFFVQEDNVNVEFNVPPAKDGANFENYIWRAIQHIEGLLPPTVTFARRDDGSGFYRASMVYKPEFLASDACQRFGCEPDYNAYTKEENPKPKADNPYLRTAAAHIHVGWDKPTLEQRLALVKALDVYVGYALIGQDDPERKKLYGKAGSFRPKPYGIEYRVVDNCWLSQPAQVFQWVREAADAVNRGLFPLSDKIEKAVIEAVNAGKKSLAVRKYFNERGVFV